MAIHEEVLRAANEIACKRADWTFSPEEIVRALPQLNENSVRVDVVSRCCVNAPRNHAHKWDYFRRLSRAKYQVEPSHRQKGTTLRNETRVVGAERSEKKELRRTIHCVVHREPEAYVGECLEFAVVTQGQSLDEVIENFQDALALHLEDEDLEALGFAAQPRVQVVLELPLAS